MHAGHKIGDGTPSRAKQVSEPSADENQNSNSPARQMLDALSRASKEMTRRLDETTEQASKLNHLLETKVNTSLAEITQQSELLVKEQLQGVSVEKELILAELIQLRQDELKVLQGVSKELRDALTDKLNDSLSVFKSEVKDQVAIFRGHLKQKETETNQSLTILRMALKEKGGEQIALIHKKVAENKKELEDLHTKHKDSLSQEESASLKKLIEHGDELNDRLKKTGTSYFKSIDLTLEEMLAAQAEKLEQRVKDFSTLQEKAREQLQLNTDFSEKLPASFDSSCKEIADLKVDLHDNMVKNLAHVYRTEMVNIAKDTDDKLLVIHSNLQSSLRNFMSVYSEKSAAMISSFEKKAKEAKPATIEAEDESVEAQVDTYLDKIRKELRKTAKDVVSAADTSIEQRFTEFQANLQSTSQTASASVESSFNDYRKSIAEYGELHREALEELKGKGDALDQLIGETRELIEAMNHLNRES